MSSAVQTQAVLSLDAQREAFARRRFLAMPLAGLIAWSVIGLVGSVASLYVSVLTLYAATGSIVYLGMLLSRLTGENLMDKRRPKNEFDKLFMLTVAMALLVYAIALPFAAQDYSSLPMSVGILTGLMWLPVSWFIQHWIGIAHGVARTVLVLGAWYAFPDQRFVIIPAIIVALYVVVIVVLERRWHALQAAEKGEREKPLPTTIAGLA
ncbi:MAG: hypothetical protein K2W93_14760 [Burkholderiaceae bacterium]|nr:hypothetical protein [Burkholderiaceae bacterium]